LIDVDERDIAMTTRWLITLLCAITAASPASALTECHAMSGDRAVAVIELYTSEGCDSCPPADRWLGGLKLDPASAVALAFHVDYWDRLGWQDRFASAAYTRRQYEQAGRQREELVYTPQILLQGREFVTWRDGTRAAAALAAIGAKRPRANIELVAQRKLEVAMMMALEPTIFMFDEPTAGMSVDEVPVILDLIARLKTDTTKTILLVEHKMAVVRSLADRIIVLNNGQLVADGEPAAVIASPIVQEAYLGVSPGKTA
jgi:Protein of unknown function (DUF1223)/Branched-chain amino acid ATP-binding cassette transporter